MMRKRRERKRLRSESSAVETVTDCSGTIIRGLVINDEEQKEKKGAEV